MPPAAASYTTLQDPFEQDDWEPAAAMTAANVCQVSCSLLSAS